MPVSPTDELEDAGAVENLNDSTDGGQGSQADDTNTDDSKSADASTAGDVEKPSLLDAISSALNPEEEKSSISGDEGAKAADIATDKPSGNTEVEDDADLGEVTEEELRGYRDKTRRRIKHFMGKVNGLETELSELRPMAERMANVEKFVEDNGLSTENMNTLFEGAVKLKKGGLTDEDFRAGVETMLAVNNDPQRAVELLMPLMESLLTVTGEVLSPELAQQVNDGQLTEDAARELSRHRATRVYTEVKHTEEEKRTELQAQERAKAHTAQLANAVATGVTNWEQNWKTRDPDYAIKSSLWRDKMDAYIARVTTSREPFPADAKAVIAVAEKLKSEVESTLLKMRPARKAIQSTPQGVGTSTGSKAAPSSLKEAIGIALGQQ